MLNDKILDVTRIVDFCFKKCYYQIIYIDIIYNASLYIIYYIHVRI